MFGAKYSRLKYWVISLILFVIFAIITSFGRFYADNGEYDIAIKYNIISMIVSLMWINTLANRIRDYRGNPWFALFSLIPIVNLALGLYYGFTKYKKTSTADIQKTTTEAASIKETEYAHSDDNKSNLDDIDDEVYESIADELKNSKRKEGVWLKALNNSDGNENKALTLYTKYRAKAIQDEITEKNEQAAAFTKLENDKNDYYSIRERKLQTFLKQNSLSVVERRINGNNIKVKHTGGFLLNLITSSVIYYANDKWSYA